MTRFLRWQGVVSFVVLSALVVVFLYMFAETLVKRVMVNSAEGAFGAEVNISEVKLAYSPLQVSILGLQVTDKENSNLNLFSFERASANVDVWQYLFGKIIIDELEVSKLEFSSVRAHPGQVYSDDKSKKGAKGSLSDQAKDMLSEVDMKLPDVKTLLNDSNLLTVKASKKLQATYEAEKIKLKALKAQLPSKAKVKSYQDQIKALSQLKVKSLADIEKIKTDFDKIKAQFKSDQALVKKAKQQVLASKELLVKQVNELKDSPSKDWKHIEKTYQLESIDTEDFAHIFFGEQARGYVQKAQWLYEQVSPFMGASNKKDEAVVAKTHANGRFVYFKEETPLPSVLVKKALFSIEHEQGDFMLEGLELTHQHWLRSKDSELNISSNSNGELNLNSHFRVTESGSFSADGDWSVNNRALSNNNLTTSKALSLSLREANLTGEGNFTVSNSDILATNHLSLNQASYQGEASTKVTKLLLDTIKSLDKLSIDVGVDGKIDKPGFTITSSLNDALTGAFKGQVSGKLNEFKGKVNKGLNDKLASALKLGNSQSAELLDLEALLTDTDKALADLKNSDVVEQQKKKLEDKMKNKAKDKLKNKLSDLFG